VFSLLKKVAEFVVKAALIYQQRQDESGGPKNAWSVSLTPGLKGPEWKIATERRRQRFANNLLESYYALLQLVEAGNKILSELELYAWETTHEKGNRREDETRQRLKVLVKHQLERVDRLDSALYGLEEPIGILAPSVLEESEPLILWKATILTILFDELNDEKLPLHVKLRIGFFSEKLKGATLDLSKPWGRRERSMIKKHIEENRVHLDKTRRCAEEMRGVLVRYFDLDEILFLVEDGTAGSNDSVP
jgi:hypothetical protein